MLYYGLIIISVLMFGGGFALQDAYRKKRGSGLKSSLESAFIGSIAGLLVLLIINNFSFEFTIFSFIMAFLSALNGILFTFFSFKALEQTNLSLFSLFSMLGGMALPFLQGIIFYGEKFTLAKGVALAFICVALILTIKKGEKKNKGVFCLGIFILNGMSGVLSKIFTSSAQIKTSAIGYTVLISVCTIVFAFIGLMIISFLEKRRSGERNCQNKVIERKTLFISYGISSFYGVLNKVANFLLVFALVFVDASVQYPMVTGGTMIISTLLCYFTDKKPSRKELLSVFLAFVGTLALFFIPV